MVISMGREWKIGDPVDGTTDGWMDAQNWGRREDEEKKPWQNKDLSEEYGRKAWQFYEDFHDEEALEWINRALAINENHSNNWNRKAIILEDLKRYAESERCYNRSLELKKDSVVYDNRARMLRDWAWKLIEDSKKLPDGTDMLEKAKETCKRSIKSLSPESDEDIEGFLSLWDSVNFYIGYERKYRRNLELIGKYPREDLFTITGTKFYENGINPDRSLPLRLVREPENEFDRDAIAVYVADKKIGYVANSDHTSFQKTSKASQLCGRISDTSEGEYLCYLDRYSEIQFSIARIVRY